MFMDKLKTSALNIFSKNDALNKVYFVTRQAWLCDPYPNKSAICLACVRHLTQLNLFVRYDPIILLVLLNRAKCICSEYSTDIPRYNKQDVLPNLRHHLRGETIEHMVSWYGDVEGKIEKTKDVGERGECVYTTYGKV